MPPLMLFRKLHKWVGLALGFQLVLWTVSGAAMSIIDHHAVAGEHVVRELQPAAIAAAPAPLSVLAASTPEAVTGLKLKPLLGRPVYEVRTAGGTHLADAASGRRVVVDAETARRVALQRYAGSGAVESVTRLTRPNMETRDREGVLWRVRFDDAGDTAFYVAEATGELLDKRTNAWRVFDVFWMIHIMDYTDRQSFNHPLIWTLAAAGVWMSLTGFVLLFLSFKRADFRWLRPGRARQPRRGS